MSLFGQRAFANNPEQLNWGTLDPTLLAPSTLLTKIKETEKCVDRADPFISNFKQLFYERLFPDIFFDVETEKIPAHKAILVSRSRHFRNMFTSLSAEKNQTEIKLTNIKAIVFKAILEYIYCNEVSLYEELASELIPKTEEYRLLSLKELCENFLIKRIKKENAINLLNLSEKYNSERVKVACLEFVVKHLPDIESREEMSDISKTLYLDLIKYAVHGPLGYKPKTLVSLLPENKEEKPEEKKEQPTKSKLENTGFGFLFEPKLGGEEKNLFGNPKPDIANSTSSLFGKPAEQNSNSSKKKSLWE